MFELVTTRLSLIYGTVQIRPADKTLKLKKGYDERGGVAPPRKSKKGKMKKLKAIVCTATAFIMCMGMLAGCDGNEKGSENGDDPVCTHTNLTKVEGKDATCLEEGNYTYYQCECGALFSDKNGQKPTTLQDVNIEKTRHDMHRYEEQVGNYQEYYFCNTCGRYYQDHAGVNQIPYEELLDSSVAPVALPNGWTDPAGANAENRDFTIRCFIGWTSAEGKEVSQFPNDGKVMVNLNFNRKCTLVPNPPDSAWYGFGIEYTVAEGLRYRNFETNTRTKVAPEFTTLFVRQGGIWVRVVREGTNCSFYFEDKYGIPIFISSNANFNAEEALCSFAFGQVDTTVGWTQSPAKSEICWGIANPRCVFSEQS